MTTRPKPKRAGSRSPRIGGPLRSPRDFLSMLETLEIMANPAARKAIADAKAGKGRVYTIDEITD